MIPSWFLLALMCCTVTGIQSILLLNAAKTGMSAKDLSNTMVWSQLPPLLMLWILGYAHVDLSTAWIPALLVAIAFYISLLTRQKWLEVMDGWTYFLYYRVLSSIALFTLWVLYFHEQITVTNGVGIILGFAALYFLTDRKSTSQKIIFWLAMIGIGVLCILVLNGFQKYIALAGIEPIGYTLLTSVFASCIACKDLSLKAFKKPIASMLRYKKVLIVGGLSSLLGLASYVGGIYAYKAGGDLVIVYKIVSFSLIFPMIYSVLFLGEKFTRAKMIALGLTVVSMYFLM